MVELPPSSNQTLENLFCLVTVGVDKLNEDLGEYKVVYKQVTGPSSYDKNNKFTPKIEELKGIKRILVVGMNGNVDTDNNKVVICEVDENNRITFYDVIVGGTSPGVKEVDNGTSLSHIKLDLIVVGW